jgi:hypothetical protein
MEERLYRLRHDQEAFETGSAQDKQVLLAHTVHEILLHWFAPNGEFLGLERQSIGTTRGRRYEENVASAMAAVKERIGFRPHPIQVRKFQSEEACIEDLPGEFQEHLDHPERCLAADRERFAAYIREFRENGEFVLEFTEQYWMSEDGEITHS